MKTMVSRWKEQPCNCWGCLNILCTWCLLSHFKYKELYQNVISLFVTLCRSFAVNIGPDEQEITMHINPRFNAHGDENVVVCNSYQGGNWCEEHREGGFPFQQGEDFKVRGPVCVHVLALHVRLQICSLSNAFVFLLVTSVGKCVYSMLWIILIKSLCYILHRTGRGIECEISTIKFNM